MTDAGGISPAPLLQTAVEDAAAGPTVWSRQRKPGEHGGGWGEDGLLQRRAWDLSHQLVCIVLMGEAGPGCLSSFWVGKALGAGCQVRLADGWGPAEDRADAERSVRLGARWWRGSTHGCTITNWVVPGK